MAGAMIEAQRTLEGLEWLQSHNGGLRFESDGTASAWANGIRRRRANLGAAISALRSAVDGTS